MMNCINDNQDLNMDIRSKSPNSANKQETRTNLIINHLPHNLTDQDFHKLFSEVGTIKNYRIMKDLKTGSSFGFGFVDYITPEDAARAILQLNNHAIQHKRLKVSYAQPPDGGDEKETNLYIQNLPQLYTVDNLEQLFSQYGKIVQKLIFKDKATGLPRGVGFVRYENKAEAYAAIEALNGQTPEGGSEPLVVKIAKDNSRKKKSAFQAGYQAGLARGAGRGHFQVSNRGNSFGRGNYNEMAFGANGRGFGSLTDFAGLSSDFSQQGGKISLDRSSNRYNPIGSGGGYTAGTGIGMAYEATPTQFSKIPSDTYGGSPGPNFGNVSRSGASRY